MRVVIPLLLVLTACGTPGDLDLRAFEEAEHRFIPARPANARPAVDAILAREELSLDDILAVADSLNPQLEIERKNVDLATAAIWEARLYPNPTARLEVEEYPTSGSFSDAKRVVGVAQTLPLGGRVGAAVTLAEKEREVAAIHYVWRRREILSEVKRAFVELLAARQTVTLARETREIAKSLRDVTEERLKAQAVPEMEVLKAAVGLARADADVKQAEKIEAVALKTLLAHMGDADFPKSRFAGALAPKYVVPSLDALRGQVLASHPLLEEAGKSKDAAKLAIELASAERFPDIDVSLAFGRAGDESIVEGGIEIPLPLINRNQARIAAAEVRARQAELQVQSARNDLLLRLTDAYRTFASAQERASLFADEIVPKARRALDLTNDGYAAGKFGYLDLLDAQRTLAEARSAHVATLSELNAAAVDLEKLTGAKLETLR